MCLKECRACLGGHLSQLLCKSWWSIYTTTTGRVWSCPVLPLSPYSILSSPFEEDCSTHPPISFFFIAVTSFPFNTEFYFILHLFWPCLNFLASDFHLLHNISIQKREKSWVNPLLGTPLLFHFVFSHHWVYTWSRCNFWKETGISVDAHYGASLSFRVWLQKI